VARGTWDKGISYEVAKAELLRLIAKARHEADLGSKRARKRLANLYVLLTQLENASRVSEAYEAYTRFLKGEGREIEVRIRKRKDRETRLIIIPPEVPDPPEAPKPSSLMAVKKFASDIGLNTHTLRYARITHLAKLREAPQMVAKITGHATLNMILKYVQKVQAEERLRELIYGTSRSSNRGGFRP